MLLMVGALPDCAARLGLSGFEVCGSFGHRQQGQAGVLVNDRVRAAGAAKGRVVVEVKWAELCVLLRLCRRRESADGALGV